jgi:AcrR family transcriptional regulator
MTRQSFAKRFSELHRITGLRRGTAIHDKGQERVNEILEAAVNLYAIDGYAKFSVRQVAALVGIGIRNVQYYFPTKEVLLLATIQYGFRVFDEEVDEFMQNSEHPSQDRYLAFVDYLMESIRQLRVRGFLIQTWSVAVANKEVATIMEKAYESYRKQLAELMRPLNPDLDASERIRLASILQAIIDGMTLVIGPKDYTPRDLANIERTVRDQALRLAAGSVGSARLRTSGR